MKPIFVTFLLLFSCQFCLADNQSISLHLPLDCQVGTSCFIQNYIDVDPSPDYHDYMCGFLSYNDHTGTDFRIPNMDMIHTGVKVLAAAPGKVRAIRDGMPDISIKNIDKSLIQDREAGNSVAIEHGDGWETQYSHLRQGSVLVKAGDVIQTGQQLGLVGMSGNTEFLHLHFTVRHNGKVIDPFTGMQIGAGCTQSAENSLWDKSLSNQLQYQSSGILNAGFTDGIPNAKPIYEFLRVKPSLPDNSKNIIFWVHLFGVQKNDTQIISIVGPNGKLLARNKMNFKENQAQRLVLIGKQNKGENWEPGRYKGIYTLTRNMKGENQNIINKEFYLNVEAPID